MVRGRIPRKNLLSYGHCSFGEGGSNHNFTKLDYTYISGSFPKFFSNVHNGWYYGHIHGDSQNQVDEDLKNRPDSRPEKQA